MQPLDELSGDDIQRAIRIATERYERDTHRQFMGAAEDDLVIRAPYLARAVAAIRDDNFAKRTRSRNRAAILAAIAVFVLLAVEGGFAWRLHRLANSSGSPVSTTSPPVAIRLPKPGSTLLSGIPIPAGYPLRVVGYNCDVETSVTFVNKMREPVTIYWIDFHGNRRRWQSLKPGESHYSETLYDTPFLAVGDADHATYLYYPPGTPTTAIISPKVDGAYHGYILPVSPDDPRLQTKNERPDEVSYSPGMTFIRMGFLNLTRQPVKVYTVPGGSAHVIDAGAVYSYGTQANFHYVVTDLNGRPLYTFLPGSASGMALILPKPGLR